MNASRLTRLVSQELSIDIFLRNVYKIKVKIMATIQEIIALDVRPASEIISDLKDKSVSVPSWTGRYGLVQEYDPKRHPVMNRAKYPYVVNDDGTIYYVTRLTFAYQQLAVKRMTELCCGIPVKRIYKARSDNEGQQKWRRSWGYLPAQPYRHHEYRAL